jgi:hypothetical protein
VVKLIIVQENTASMSVEFQLELLYIVTIMINHPTINQDWHRHRSNCHPRTHTEEARLYNNQTNNVESSKPILAVDALLFPVDENVPRIIKIPYTIEDDEDHPGQAYHRCRDIGKFVSGPSIKYVKTLGRKGPALNRTLAVFFGDAFLIDGSRPNRCIQCLTGGKMHLLWSGNIVVMRAEEPIYRVERWNNATMEDIIPMVRFFHEYHDSEAY